MAKDPAFLFYSQDFIVGVQVMTFEERGKYITILSQMHQQGRLDKEEIIFLVGAISNKLKKKFKIDENGLWYNERLEGEIIKRESYKPNKIASATLGGLISSGNYSEKQKKFIRKSFNINDFIELKTNEEIKKSVKLWLSECLTIYEDENEDEDESKDGEVEPIKYYNKDSLLKELENSEQWLERIAMYHKLKNTDQIITALKSWILKQNQIVGAFEKPLDDIKNHFVNTLAKSPDLIPNNTLGNGVYKSIKKEAILEPTEEKSPEQIEKEMWGYITSFWKKFNKNPKTRYFLTYASFRFLAKKSIINNLEFDMIDLANYIEQAESRVKYECKGKDWIKIPENDKWKKCIINDVVGYKPESVFVELTLSRVQENILWRWFKKMVDDKIDFLKLIK